jgi:hypothetical protein
MKKLLSILLIVGLFAQTLLAQPSESIQQTQESIEQSKKEDELYNCLSTDSIS